MEVQSPQEPDQDARQRHLELLLRLAESDDAAEREMIRRELLAAIDPNVRASALSRLASALAEEPGLEQQAAAEAQQAALVEQVLEANRNPTRAAFDAFQDYLANVGEQDEYFNETRELLYESWSIEQAEPDHSFDLSFLQLPSGRLATLVWRSQFTHLLEYVRRGGFFQFVNNLSAQLLQSSVEPEFQTSGRAEEEWRLLVQQNLDPQPHLGLTGRYQIIVQARRLDNVHCDVRVIFDGTRLAEHFGELEARIEHSSGLGVSLSFDDAGVAVFTNVPIEDLNGLRVLISVPNNLL